MTNNELKEIIKLKQKKYRYEYNKYLIEGSKIINEALSNHEDLIIYTIDKNKEGIFISKDEMKKIVTTETLVDQIGIVKMKNKKEISSDVIALDNVQDPGNLGTLIRSAVAFGYKDMILENCVDPYNPKVIRSSKGAIFRINLIQDRINNYINKYYTIGTTVKNALELNEFKLNLDNTKYKNYILILGNEANGINNDLLSKTDINIYIKTNMESLNVGVAGSIIMYELKKRG